ncbi:ferredoxin-type protein NapF [Yersinia pekkanenii]|uniref:Ferredoxin-type protein NapF n=1 Tax=Yersinia pekkanenii TaxID=1288385 RepID=A0A0T9NES4_9GAMM|nr:ferredoxin-type protein NapF [Yersinia pekkanenii]CNH03597.1 ferredoxin-type protein NapF [Yersinia pekkanenii]CRY63894.1 ferredoxin-type protein NapF [Yersinia pekkanenii]
MADLSRRKLLARFWRADKQQLSVQRPPWSVREADFIAGCTRCQACVAACETGVLVVGSGGFPEIDFQRAECTFCQACVKACDVDIFISTALAAWPLNVSISDRCLPFHSIECRSCQDSCETRAIRFRPRLNGIAQPELDLPACTGCGACVANCPIQAVTLTRSEDGR